MPLQRFVRDFMLQASAAIRQEACGVLHSLWQLATPAEQSQLFAVIQEQLSLLPLYGQAAGVREREGVCVRMDVRVT